MLHYAPFLLNAAALINRRSKALPEYFSAKARENPRRSSDIRQRISAVPEKSQRDIAIVNYLRRAIRTLASSRTEI